MPDQTSAPLTAEREQEIRDSIPTVYTAPWTVEPMEDNTWRVMYATDHPLAGLVAEVPDYGAQLAEFIAEARTAVPELLAEVRRLRAELLTAQADTLGEVATELEGIDFHPNAKSSSSDLCRPLAGRFRRKALRVLDDVRSSAAEDTLPSWLYSRFNDRLDAPAWNLLTDDDRTYWEHQARAVRRAVARGGFRSPAVVGEAGR